MRLDASVLLGECIKYLGDTVTYVITDDITDEQSGQKDTYDRIKQKAVVLMTDNEMP